MQNLQNLKFVNVTPPAAIVDNAAFTTATLDTKGARTVCWLVTLGALDIAVAAMKLRESDDSGMSGAADISGADFSVSPLTLPAATDDNKLYAIFVTMSGSRKRYQDLSLTGGDGAAGTYATVIAILDRLEQAPSTATLRGLAQQAIV
jgi:hypothetical protein